MSEGLPPPGSNDSHSEGGGAVHALGSAEVSLRNLGTRDALGICEATGSIDPPRWAALHRADIDRVLLEDGALLLRAFGVDGPRDFVRIAEALSPEIESGYSELPRHSSGENCYRSTPYPASLPILFHNESAHRTSWPLRQFFCCIEPSPVGGATPLADGRRVLEELDSRIADWLRDRGLLYVRNFSDDFDLGWQEYYGSDATDAVEAACLLAGTGFEWTSRGLRTWQRRPALAAHPRTGEEFPFHQILLHHPRCLPEDVRRALEIEYADDAMPRNVFFGDGERIEDPVVDEILGAYETAAIRFPWQAGDVLVFDNLRVAHARDAFSGPRSVLVALGAFLDCDE